MYKKVRTQTKISILLLVIFVTIQTLGYTAPTAQAFLVSVPGIPTTKEVLDDTMDYFGVPKDQRTFGVANRKAQAPQVRVEFSPANPKPGEEVTATAYTSGFRDAPQDQYYTWYLRDGTTSLKEKDLRSDDDKDDMYENMEVYKRDAHRIIAASQTLSRFSAAGSDGNSDGYKSRLGGHSQQKTTNDYCYMYDFEDTGIMYEIDDGFKKQCNGIEKGSERTTHLFPQPQISDEKYDYNFITGDGDFGEEEEKYWGTDNGNPMSSGNGKLDEENIVGRGVNQFTWIYEKGDEVGVVVEGSSHIRTPHDDASFATMFAFLHNRCDLLGKQQTGEYTETIRGNNTRFNTINMDREDLTKCLYDNFIPVGEGGKPSAMAINLSFMPNSPSVGLSKMSAGGEIVHLRPADEITVTAQIENSQKDLSQVHFTWCAEEVENITNDRASENLQCYTKSGTNYIYDSGSFKDDTIRFTSPASTTDDTNIESQFENPDEIRAIGMSSIAFILNNLNPTTKYLKVRVEAGENFSPNTKEVQGGYAIAYIPIQDLNATYLRANTVDSNTATLSVSNTEICANSEANNTLCRVGKNEIIGLDLSTNDNEIKTSEISALKFRIEGAGSSCIDQCANDPDKEFFFAVTGGAGETITIKASYTNIETGKDFNLSRTFIIVDPYIEVIPSSGATKKSLGNYIDLDGNEYLDESNTVFEAELGSSVELQAISHPSWGAGEDFYWKVNGEGATGSTVTIPVDSITNVSVQTTYTPDQSQKNALEDHFNFSSLLVVERPTLTSVQIVPTSNLIVENDTQKFLANISTNAPSYILFLIRTLLMVGMIIFIAMLIFGISPKKDRT